MAFSKARRLSDLISSTGEVSAYADASIVPADLHSTLNLTGKTITVATASAGDNDTTVASTAFVQQELASLVDSAPGSLNTLNELAAALNDDASFSTTVTNSIATKLPLAGGTMTGTIAGFTSTGIDDNATSSAITIDSSEKVFINGGVNIATTAGNTNLQVLTTNSQGADLGGSIGMGGVYNATNQITFAEIHGKKTNSTAANLHGYMAFVTRGDNIAERMRIDSTGKVGIGNNNPIRLLDIKDPGTGDPGIRLESQSYSMDVITLRNGDGRVGFGGDAITVLQSGNVGIGAIPKTTESGWTNLSVGGQGALINSTSANAGGRTQLSNNVYVDESGNYSYISTDEASLYKQINGIHSWHSAGSGSANAHITMSERMRIHANGKVGFSANGMGDVSTIPRDFAFFTEGSTNGVEIRSNDQRLMMLGAGGSGGTGSDDGYLTMSSQGAAKLWLSANGSSVFNGGSVGINRTPSVSASKLEIGGADNVRLLLVEASGHTGGIGINGGTTKSRGLQLFSGSNIIATLSNQTNVGYVSDGLFGTNARPTRINCTGSGQMLFGYTDSGSGLYSAAMGMEFDEHNGQNPPISQWVDGWVMKATVSGTKTLRIETDGDIYNVNGTFSSGSDRRIKKEISDASSQWDDVKAVRVRKFKLGATEAGSPHDHFHIGVIAQEIEEAGMNGLVKETTPDDGHIRFNPDLAGDKIKTVKYSILQMKAFKALQEAMEKIETLEAKVAALEAE